jgi:hypothetical protein
LINGASDITPGQYGSGPFQEVTARPDNAQGWGRVDLENTLFPGSPRTFHYFDVTDGLSTGESHAYYFLVNSLAPLKVTLVWTDYPSTISASKNLVNDLDLTVTGPDSVTHYPNNGDSPDTLNNVEGIDILSPSLGLYTVIVSPTRWSLLGISRSAHRLTW